MIVKVFFHISKEMINIMAAFIEKIIVSNAFVIGINKEADAVYFIGYETDNKIRPLFIEVPQMNGFHNVYKKNSLHKL